jgi:hypothetical protein
LVFLQLLGLFDIAVGIGIAIKIAFDVVRMAKSYSGCPDIESDSDPDSESDSAFYASIWVPHLSLHGAYLGA